MKDLIRNEINNVLSSIDYEQNSSDVLGNFYDFVNDSIVYEGEDTIIERLESMLDSIENDLDSDFLDYFINHIELVSSIKWHSGYFAPAGHLLSWPNSEIEIQSTKAFSDYVAKESPFLPSIIRKIEKETDVAYVNGTFWLYDPGAFYLLIDNEKLETLYKDFLSIEIEQKIELLLCDARGIYIPRDFADIFGDEWGLTSEDKETLSDPENEWYWDTWERILNNLQLSKDGKIYRLWHDGDLYAYDWTLSADAFNLWSR